MNVTTVAPNPKNTRLARIQKISGLLKFGVLLYWVMPLFLFFDLNKVHLPTGRVCIFNHSYASAADIPAVMYILYALGAAVYLLGIISFYRLLCLYEKGVIFSAANVSEIKKLGSYLVFYGLLAFVAEVVSTGRFVLVLPWSLLEMVSSPWIVAGGAINLVAWIMDEGRKIQEEQELTV